MKFAMLFYGLITIIIFFDSYFFFKEDSKNRAVKISVCLSLASIWPILIILSIVQSIRDDKA